MHVIKGNLNHCETHRSIYITYLRFLHYGVKISNLEEMRKKWNTIKASLPVLRAQQTWLSNNILSILYSVFVPYFVVTSWSGSQVALLFSYWTKMQLSINCSKAALNFYPDLWRIVLSFLIMFMKDIDRRASRNTLPDDEEGFSLANIFLQYRASLALSRLDVRTASVSDYVGSCPSFFWAQSHLVSAVPRSFSPVYVCVCMPDVFWNFLRQCKGNTNKRARVQGDLQYSRENSGHVRHFRFARRTSLRSEHLPMQIFSYGRGTRNAPLVLGNPYFAVK